MNISEASKPIAIKFHLKLYWDGGKAAWGFGADQFRALIFKATVSYNGTNGVITFSRMFLIGSFSYL